MAELMKQLREEFTTEHIKEDKQEVKNKQIFDNKESKDVSRLSVDKSAHCKIQEDSTHRQKKSITSNIKQQKNANKTDLPTSSEIRQLLVKNLPQMQTEIRIINQEDLYDLYNFFRQSSQPPSKSKNPQKIQMMTTILRQVPSMKDKLCNCTEAQIKKIYNSLKSVRTHPSCTMFKNKGKRSQTEKNFAFPKANSKKMDRFESILSSSQQTKGNINQFSDLQYQNNSLQQQQEWVNKNSSKNHDISKKRNFQTAFANNKYLGGTQLEIPILRKEKVQDNYWEMKHGDGENVIAHTYVMVHTQYAGQPRKRLKGQTTIGKCICSCCKNNTFVNIFKQIVQQIEARKK